MPLRKKEEVAGKVTQYDIATQQYNWRELPDTHFTVDANGKRREREYDIFGVPIDEKRRGAPQNARALQQQPAPQAPVPAAAQRQSPAPVQAPEPPRQEALDGARGRNVGGNMYDIVGVGGGAGNGGGASPGAYSEGLGAFSVDQFSDGYERLLQDPRQAAAPFGAGGAGGGGVNRERGFANPDVGGGGGNGGYGNNDNNYGGGNNVNNNNGAASPYDARGAPILMDPEVVARLLDNYNPSGNKQVAETPYLAPWSHEDIRRMVATNNLEAHKSYLNQYRH